MSWASFAFATDGGVDGDGSGGETPRLVVIFDFVLFGAKFFGLARDVFGTVGFTSSAPLATARIAPLAAAACGTTCVPARHRLRKLVDKTMLATSAGGGGGGWDSGSSGDHERGCRGL
jgi:hypothetical protein